MIRFATLARRRPAPCIETTAPADASIEGPATAGCGWFDSSHELHTGLLVQEHRPGECGAELAALPLTVWLDLQLQGGRPLPDWQAAGR